MSNRFNARAWWAALSPEQQRTIGEMTLLSWVAPFHEISSRWQHAGETAELLLSQLMPDPRDYPEGPDLAALGIRACRQCGCTDTSAYETGCSWVAEDLCSACAQGELAL